MHIRNQKWQKIETIFKNLNTRGVILNKINLANNNKIISFFLLCYVLDFSIVI